MRLSLLAVAVTLTALVGCGNPVPDAKPSKAGSVPSDVKTLSVGDPAPAWKVTNWLNGAAVEKAEAGKVYVLEFWATWCGPCVQVMPHLSELQAKHRDQGLVVIGMTRPDDRGNDLNRVTQFAEKMGSKMGYLVGFDATGTTHRDYMQAAGQRGIPCSFVIDRAGKVAYIGHPARLDDVLPKVLDGSWKGRADVDALDKMYAQLEQVFSGSGSPETALAKLDEFAKAHPELAKRTEVQSGKMGLLVAAKRWDEVKGLGETLLATAEKEKRAETALAVMSLGNPQMNPDKQHLKLAVSAADLLVKLEDRNPQILLNSAVVYAAAGQKEKATAVGRKAAEFAPNDKARTEILKLLDQALTAK